MTNTIQCCFKRYEKKYMLTPAQQATILDAIRTRMKPDEHASYTICNIYYDTEDFALIRESLAKPVYKEKLRVRSYGTARDDSKVFVEIKKKYDGVVYKRRVTTEAANVPGWLGGEKRLSPGGQISREIDWFQQVHRTRPRVFIAYDRVAFAGIDQPDLRITFDTNIRWRETDLDLRYGDCGTPLLAKDQVLMEIKIPGTAPLWLAELLSEAGAFQTSFSKYGTYYKTVVLRRQNAERNGHTGKEMRKSA
jgi:hypothetical protein